jgi:hypothetical protein
MLVKDVGISPRDAWDVTMEEFFILVDIPEPQSEDISMMINFERKANGAKDKRYLIQ